MNYSAHIDKIAHLNLVTLRRFGHLPTEQAIQEGEAFDRHLNRIWSGHNKFLLKLDLNDENNRT